MTGQSIPGIYERNYPLYDANGNLQTMNDVIAATSDVFTFDNLNRIMDANGAHGVLAYGDQNITVPVSAMRMLVNILAHMAEGEAVALIPQHAELTTQQAADFLNISRPFFVKLLEEGKLAFHKVGSHRRVYFRDLVAYKEQSMEEQRKALDELSAQAQDPEAGLLGAWQISP